MVTYQEYRDGVGPSPKGGGVKLARTPLNPPPVHRRLFITGSQIAVAFHPDYDYVCPIPVYNLRS